MQIIRPVTPADAAEVLSIYAPFILDTAITFEADVPTREDFAQRISNYLSIWPWLVMEDGGKITGYAYAGRHRERMAYQWCVESSVYIHPQSRGKGVGSSLYRALFDLLSFQGFRNVYAGITLPNEGSIALHQKLGFKRFAEFENIGFKDGRWHTVGWWRKTLNDFKNPPLAPLKFSELETSKIKELIHLTTEEK